MKGKKHTLEQKVHLLIEARSNGKNLEKFCREKNLSKLTLHRWMRQFGHLDIHEICRLMESERNKIQLKRTLAEWALKHRLLSCIADGIV
ncbi:MAG: transposase [Limisphaerales bacterium]